jgi:sortase A
MFTLAEDPVDRILVLVNRFLTIIFLILITYILWTPFIGEIIGLWRKSIDKTGGYVYQSSFAREMIKKGLIHTTSNDLKAIPTANTLVIPKINVDAPILDGADAQTLNRGFWRRPKTSTPDKGGNTVITGHRFLYTSGPNTFYDLNKVIKGDDIIVYWGGKEYSYRVDEVKVVEPEDIEIEEFTNYTVLTLYTCTPIWTSKQRLVVRALPVDPSIVN